MNGKVIVLDASETIKYRISDVLAGFEMEAVFTASPNEALMFFKNNKTDVNMIIMDHTLGRRGEFDLLEEVRKLDFSLPVLILTGENKRGSFVDSIISGASDYILKPFENGFLTKRLGLHFTGKFYQFQDKVQKSIAGTEHRLYAYDNSENYRNFLKQLKDEVEKAKHANYSVSACGFRVRPREEDQKVNRVHLAAIAALIKKEVWEGDFFTPFHEDMFLTIFPICNIEEAKQLLGKIDEGYKKMIEENDTFDQYKLEGSMVTYPSDAHLLDNLVETLFDRMS